MENVLRAAERRLGVHDPILAEQGSKKGAKDRLVRKGLETAGKSQLVFAKCFLESRRELAAEHTAEHFDGQEECIARMNPPLVIERKAAGRNHAVDMGMVPSSRTIP